MEAPKISKVVVPCLKTTTLNQYRKATRLQDVLVVTPQNKGKNRPNSGVEFDHVYHIEISQFVGDMDASN